MNFSKLQATGNDFIVVDSIAGPTEYDCRQLARIMCDRHFGVGADGLIVVQSSVIADCKMQLFNPDGSEAEVSGNGLRCLAKYVIEKGLVPPMASKSWRMRPNSLSLTVETLAGVRKIKASLSGGKVKRVQVSMGLPRFHPEQIPVKVKLDGSTAGKPILNYPLTIDGQTLTLSIVSMGNPHAVSFSCQSVTDFPLLTVGPKVEKHSAFPQKTNFEVARVLSRKKIEARVWERGVGETLACGSGACAVAVAAQLLNYVGEQVDIMMPGGILNVRWDRAGEVLLAGPVEEVFRGEWLGGQG